MKIYYQLERPHSDIPELTGELSIQFTCYMHDSVLAYQGQALANYHRISQDHYAVTDKNRDIRVSHFGIECEGAATAWHHEVIKNALYIEINTWLAMKPSELSALVYAYQERQYSRQVQEARKQMYGSAEALLQLRNNPDDEEHQLLKKLMSLLRPAVFAVPPPCGSNDLLSTEMS